MAEHDNPDHRATEPEGSALPAPVVAYLARLHAAVGRIAEHYAPSGGPADTDKYLRMSELQRMVGDVLGAEPDADVLHDVLVAQGYRYDVVPGQRQMGWAVRTAPVS